MLLLLLLLLLVLCNTTGCTKRDSKPPERKATAKFLHQMQMPYCCSITTCQWRTHQTPTARQQHTDLSCNICYFSFFLH
jgi:hypothetical protein